MKKMKKSNKNWKIQQYKKPRLTPRQYFYDDRIEKFVVISITALDIEAINNGVAIGGFIISEEKQLKIQYIRTHCGVFGYIIVDNFYPIIDDEIAIKKEHEIITAKNLVNYLFNCQIEFVYNQKHYKKNIGDILKLLAYYRTGYTTYIPPKHNGREFGSTRNYREISNALACTGLRVDKTSLIIPYRHPALSVLLKNAGYEADWNKVFINLPKATDVQAYFEGKNHKSIKIPLHLVLLG